jgi:hypothetical protein
VTLQEVAEAAIGDATTDGGTSFSLLELIAVLRIIEEIGEV